MTRYIAFLRAINITGRYVKMDVLRGLFEQLGFGNVSTFIASGNVLFDAEESADALEPRIETHLREALSFEVATFLRTPDEVAAIAACRPFPAAQMAQLLALAVAFIKQPPGEAELARLMGYRRASDDFAVIGREVYWGRFTPISETNFAGATLERVLRAPATVRNVTTVRRLAGIVDGYQ
jgi:uncharacterized protein (DUF1697 family)